MYLKMFNATTDAIEILKKAQAEAEEMYISYEPTNLKLITKNDSDD